MSCPKPPRIEPGGNSQIGSPTHPPPNAKAELTQLVTSKATKKGKARALSRLLDIAHHESSAQHVVVTLAPVTDSMTEILKESG